MKKIQEVINMARNLVNKKSEAEDPVVPAPAKAEEPQIQVVTMEQLILARLDSLTALTVEGFKQVGVDFDKPKE